jgi:peptidoglycan/xylan/chitin deacetylase (PgdA/CDA1 family)
MARNFSMRFPGGKPKAFTLSYDDGVEQDERLIGIFDKYGLKGTFNLSADLFSPEGTTFPEGRVHRRLTRARSLEIFNKNGHEVATHGFTHPWLNKIPEAVATYEMIKDREGLEEMFGCIVNGHAYPYGAYNDTVVEVLKNCGIVYARTTKATERFDIPTDWLRLHPTCHHNHPRVFELCDQFVGSNYNTPQLFYLWGHSYEFEGDNNWERIEQIAEKISGKSDIWYANNIEIYNYVKAYEALVVSADLSRVYNPTALEIFFVFNGKNYSVKPAQTISLK